MWLLRLPSTAGQSAVTMRLRSTAARVTGRLQKSTATDVVGVPGQLAVVYRRKMVIALAPLGLLYRPLLSVTTGRTSAPHSFSFTCPCAPTLSTALICSPDFLTSLLRPRVPQKQLVRLRRKTHFSYTLFLCNWFLKLAETRPGV